MQEMQEARNSCWWFNESEGPFSMSGTGTIIPLKIFFPARGYQIGVAAKSLQHLRDTLQAKMGLSNKFKLTLDDGTIVCDPEYFKLLERQTKLNVIESSPVSKTTTNEASVDTARKRTSPSAPAAANKRARLSPESQRDKADLNTNQNNSQLLSKICISSVAGSVPMSESPKSASERPRLPTAVQRQKQLLSIPQPQVQIQNNPPRCTQKIQSPPAQPLQVQNTVSSLQHLHQKPAGKTVAVQRPGSIIMVPPHPQIQQSIPGSALVHPSLHQRPPGAPFPQRIVIPSNQPNAFPGHPHTPLSAPPMITPPPIQWIRHGYPQSVSPYGNVIHPQSQHCPPGGVLYPHQMHVPHQQLPMYHPRPPPPPPPPLPQQQLTQERIYQMQVEQQMKTTIRMTPPPNQSQMPLSPQPVQRSIAVAQTQPVPVIRSPVGPKPSVFQQAQPATLMPDGEHIVQQVVELLQAPEPMMIPSTPPALLKVVCSKPPTQSRHVPTSDPSNSADVSGLSTPTPISNSESTNLQGMQVAPEDTDSEDEHALQIVVTAGESENLPASTPPPCAPSSPQSHASSSPSRSPVIDTALNTQKPCKPTELNLLASQIDDGYCSATASSLGSADDVKRALPFASFDEYIPLHSCYNENKEDPQENHAIVSIISQDECTVTNPKDNSTLSDEHKQQDTATRAPSVIVNECLDHTTDEREEQHMVTDWTQSAVASEDLDNESLTIEIPIKVVDGQIYYDDHVGDKIQIKEEPDAARQEVIFIDSELEDCDSDVNMFEHFINQGTPNSFHLSLDDDDEVSEVDADFLDNSKSVESKGDIDEDVVVEEHGAEVPVVTTPLDYNIALDLDKCVADIINVVNSKDKDIQNADSPCSSKAETTDQVPNNTSTPLSTCLGTKASSMDTTHHYDGEAVVEESVLIDSSNLHEEGVLSDELVMGNEVVLSLEGSSQALDYMDTSEFISNLLLHSCLPQNGGRVSLS